MEKNPFISNNKNKIRLIFLISSLALMIMLALSGLLFLSNENAQADVVYWTSNGSSSFAGGTGTSSDPYKITNAEQLARMARYVNNYSGYASKCYSLENNISLVAPDSNGNQLVWEPIGTESNIFSGTFSGNGYTINGLFITQTKTNYAGLFGCVSGKIESIRVEGTISLANTVDCIGGIIAKKTGDTQISKLSSNVNILATKATNIGGIVGYSESGIDQCMSLGSIVGNEGAIVGGIVGCSSGAITNCYNKGNVEATESGSKVGGIVGYFGSEFNVIDVTEMNMVLKMNITDCFNLGAVRGSGIVGYGENYYSISNCYNNGMITGGAGIIGSTFNYVTAWTLSNCYNLATINGDAGLMGFTHSKVYFSISNCYNKGKIVANDGAVGCGGVISQIRSSLPFDVNNCVNYGDINFDCTGGSDLGVGGVIGWIYIQSSTTNYKEIKDCKNSGNITVTNTNRSVGGVIGWIGGCGIRSSNLINDGKIEGVGPATGGIIGSYGTDCNYGTNGNIIYSVNYGNVVGASCVGGIVGKYEPVIVSETGYLSLIANCTNFGEISRSKLYSSNIGGIVGYFATKDGDTTDNKKYGGCGIKECINYGVVNISGYGGSNFGGIVGYFESDVSILKTDNYINNCLNVGKVKVSNGGKTYVGAMVGRNYNNTGSMSGLYYCDGIGIKAYGTKNGSTDSSNGKATSQSIQALMNSTGFVGLYKDWCMFPTELSNTNLESAFTNLQTSYSSAAINNLILIKNVDYDGTDLSFNFMKDKTNSSVWAFENSRINNGEPYFKDRYW